MRCDEVIISSV